MKSFVIVILTSIWLIGILVPPIIQLLDVPGKFISININEEEPQEQNKKDLNEEFILSNISGHHLLNFAKINAQQSWDHRFLYLSHIAEIQVPPPKYFL
jgi:hypothetical protein